MSEVSAQSLPDPGLGAAAQALLLPPHRRQAWSVRTETGEHSGEILVTREWHRAFGALHPTANLAFRLVLLTAPQTVPTDDLTDPAVLCWMPAESPPAADHPDRRVAEPQAGYVAAVDPVAFLTTAPGRFLSALGETGLPAPGRADLLEQTLATHLGALERQRRSAAPYLDMLLAGTAPPAPGGSAAAEALEVIAALGPWRDRVDRIQTAIRAAGPETPGPDYLALAAGVQRLARIVSCATLPQFGLAVERTYDHPDAFRRDLDQHHRLAAALPLLEQVASVVSYLRGMQLRPSDHVLHMDRQQCLLQANPVYVLQNPSLWNTIAYQFQGIQTAYAQLYQTLHRDYHLEAAALQRRLRDLAPYLGALELLNTLDELGPPLGQELREEYTKLERALTPCPRSGSDLDLEAGPACPDCGISLAAAPPVPALEGLAPALHRALGQQQRRLSSRVVRRILGRNKEPRVARLIQIVQVSDLAPLVNVLDHELVVFLRELLRGRESR